MRRPQEYVSTTPLPGVPLENSYFTRVKARLQRQHSGKGIRWGRPHAVGVVCVQI
jgi:hypothetical protein